MADRHTDLTYLNEVCAGDGAQIRRYILAYLDRSPVLFAELMAKANAGDAKGLSLSAHSLRPLAIYMGAQRLFDLLTDIEQEAPKEGAAACIEKVHDSCALNEHVMRELRAGTDGQGNAGTN